MVFAVLLLALGVGDWLPFVGVGFGGIAGVAQGYALNNRLDYAVAWAVVSLVTLLVSGYVFMIEDNLLTFELAVVCWGLVYGASMAAMLWFLVRAEAARSHLLGFSAAL